MNKFLEIYRNLQTQINAFDNNALMRLIKIFCGAAAIVILYAFVFCGFQVVDEFEHLHASWLVSIGKAPYRDFFEHHNPLLWYLSAPIVSLFYDNVIIFYVMRGVSAAATVLTMWYMYKTVLFFGNKLCGWLAVALYLGNLITVYNFYQFRPDVFMNLCFIMGVYYWFCYLKDKRTISLVYSFLAWTVSALFLQKISLILGVVQVIILWQLIRKQMTIKAAVIASVPTLIVMCAFVFFLVWTAILPEYVELNYRFNQAMIYYFERGAFWYRYLWLEIYGLALIVSVVLYKRENEYFKIIAILYVAEFLMRAFYFAPHPNYYTLLTILEAMILGVIAEKCINKSRVIAIILMCIMFINLGAIFNRIDANSKKHNSYMHYRLSQFVHKNSTKNDLVMNGYDMNFNVYRNDVHYYWFGLDMLLPIMEQEYNLEQKLDVNNLIIQYRPKFIYTKDYVDLWAMRKYGEIKYSQQFLPELIELLYAPTTFQYLAVLK
jgi:hypothetical protein